MRSFHRAIPPSVAYRQGTLTHPNTWSRPIWDLHMFYLLRPILIPNFSYFTGLCTPNIPRYFLDFVLRYMYPKNKTNHLISSNSHPSATANKAIHRLKIGGGGFTKPRGTSCNFDKVWSGAPDGRLGKYFLIRDTNNLDNKPNRTK